MKYVRFDGETSGVYPAPLTSSCTINNVRRGFGTIKKQGHAASVIGLPLSCSCTLSYPS